MKETMNNRCIKYMLLALTLISGHALADSIGNGSGWCQPSSGTHDYPFSFNQTITTTDENKTGKIIEQSWSGSGEYAAQCDCDNTDFRGPNYFTATTGSLTQKGTFSESRYYGHMDYYVLVSDKLEIGTEVYIAGQLGQYVPVPFSSKSNNDSSAGGCTGAEMKSMTAGNRGTVRIYVTHPLVGQIVIPETTIMNLYLSKVATGSGDNIPPSVPPVAHVTMSGTITVPQSCTIEAGQVIEVKLDDILGKDISHLGDSPTQKTTKFAFTCSNVANGTNLSIALYGENDPNNRNYLKTTNDDIGIKITDIDQNIIAPNGSSYIPVPSYVDGTGSSQFTAAPVNTTGNIPHTGEYEATATLELQIR